MMLASGQVCYGCSKAGASPLLVFLESAQIRPIRQRTTRATALEMAAQLPALQWYVWSPRHEDSARLHPGAQRPTARRQRFLFSFLCPHRHPRILRLENLWLLRVRHTRQTVRVRMH